MAKSEPRKKVCASCRKLKSFDQFGDNMRMRNGKKSYCRSCEKRKKAAWKKKQANREK